MVGHATLLVQVAGLNILTDPVWSDRASPFQRAGPKRVTEPGIRFDCLPPVDAILLSHNHYDHLDLSTLERLHAAHTPLIVTPLGNDQIVRARVPNARIETGDWHQRVALGTEVEVAIVPANHWSARRLGDRRMALWSGFYLFHPRGRLYFAGDTGYGGGTLFRNLRAAYGAPDMALLPIGAYEPRWFMAPQHVNPAEAVRIMTDIGARQAIGIHWGTFQLTNEAREAPVEALRAALEEQAIPENLFRAASPGDVFAAQPGTDTLELLPKSP
jgi:L-ascorbate metabolism protein UlaG (beta-lactamase superfamily)